MHMVRIAAYKNLEHQHKIRITGVEKGSFNLLLEVWKVVGENADQLQALGAVGGGASGIVVAILGLIKLTKHVKKKPYTETVNGQNQSVVIKNSDNVDIEMPIQIFNIFKEGAIAQDLSKISKPIEHGKIDSANITAKYEEKTMEEKITLEEKPYFEVGQVEVTKTQEQWLEGRFNSLTKSTNRGFFHLNDGTRVSYVLTNDDPVSLYQYFIYNGPVSVRCVAHLDENLKPILLDIFEIKKLQGELFTNAEAE